MESVFCFEIAIDDLKLRKGISCNIPFVSIVFLKFPTIVIQLNKAVHQKANRYTFQKGKSCLFKISPTELYKQLTSTPIYLLVLDQGEVSVESKRQKCIGTSAFDLNDTIKHVVQDIQNFGMNKTSSRGKNLTLTVCNIMQDAIGYIEVAYKLTCLGHAMLPHLSATVPLKESPVREKKIQFEIPSVAERDSILDENSVCPPALYYRADKPKKQKSPAPQKENVSEDTTGHENKENEAKLKAERNKNIVIEWRDKMETFIQVGSRQKSESTQTSLQHLSEFPILQGLIKEVVELGLNQPTVETKHKRVAEITAKSKPVTYKKRPLSSSVIRPKVSPLKQRPQSSFTPKKSPSKSLPKKKYPLSYGLTKSHLLRLSTNRQTYFSHTFSEPFTPSKTYTLKKPKRSKPIKKSAVKHTFSHQLVSTYTQTLLDDRDVKHYDSLSEDVASDSESIELPFATNVKELDDLSLSRDKSSPRALSRQSIEIRLPSALTEDFPADDVEEPSSQYKYSDDFDDDHSTSEHTDSVITTLDSSPQPTTSYDTTTIDDPERASPNRLFADLSPQPTVSELSPAVSFRLTPRDSILEEPEKEYLESVISTVEDDKPRDTDPTASPSLLDLPSSPETMPRSPKDISPTYESQDDDSKPTDDSASIATAVMATKLPKPAPSSDSPVIRSLVSEPGGRKPRPPTISNSSSVERIHRKFRKSVESSFQISDLSDVRTSDLADIRTSDLSDLKSTADSLSPIHSTEVLGSNTSLPTLLKKKK